MRQRDNITRDHLYCIKILLNRLGLWLNNNLPKKFHDLTSDFTNFILNNHIITNFNEITNKLMCLAGAVTNVTDSGPL